MKKSVLFTLFLVFISIGIVFGAEICIKEGTNQPTPERCDANGNLKVTLGTAISSGVDSITVYPPTPSYTNITTDTGTQIKSTAGYLFSVVVNTAGASTTATIYDNTACSGAIIGIVSTGAQTFLNYGPGVYFSSGLCITTSNGTPDADITVVWK